VLGDFAGRARIDSSVVNEEPFLNVDKPDGLFDSPLDFLRRERRENLGCLGPLFLLSIQSGESISYYLYDGNLDSLK